MQRLNCLKIICFLNVISLVIIIIFTNRNSRTSSSVSLLINSTTLHPIKTSFKDERINQLLANPSLMYNHSLNECNITKPLTVVEERAFDTISITLGTFRSQMIPYPNEYFHGRGIVLTTGKSQLKFAKINLKMLELTGTRLPVQVLFIILYIYAYKSKSD
jgi:hypothetical protein